MFDDSRDAETLASGDPNSWSAKGIPGQCRRYRRSHTSNAATEMIFPAKEAPHCETCLCLAEKIKCPYRRMSFSSRYGDQESFEQDEQELRLLESPMKPIESPSSIEKRRLVRNTAVDKLLREMELNVSNVSGEKREPRGSPVLSSRREYTINQQEQMTCQHRPHHPQSSGASGYYNLMHRQPELLNSIDRRQRSLEEDEGLGSQHRRNVIPVIGKFESDVEVSGIGRETNDKWMQIDRQSSVALFGAGDLHELIDSHNDSKAEGDKEIVYSQESTPSQNQSEDLNSNIKEFGNSEAHVRELKLVRLEFIEHIYQEMRRLQRLQRHLDGCSPRRRITSTRSISTMTSARSWTSTKDNETHDS